MGTAVELPTPPQDGCERRAFRLSPPVSYQTLERGDWITASTEHIVLSRIVYPVAEILAFPGVHSRSAVLFRERVQILEMSEVAAIKGSGGTVRALLEQMGYETITDLNGITTVRTPERGAGE